MSDTPRQRIERRMRTFVQECDRARRRRPTGKALRDLHERMVRAAARAERRRRD